MKTSSIALLAMLLLGCQTVKKQFTVTVRVPTPIYCDVPSLPRFSNVPGLPNYFPIVFPEGAMMAFVEGDPVNGTPELSMLPSGAKWTLDPNEARANEAIRVAKDAYTEILETRFISLAACVTESNSQEQTP